jgi:DNA-binding CsgD family transcriptional regulator
VARDGCLPNPLFPREQQALRLIASGLTKHEAARRMGVVAGTVTGAIFKVKRRLGVGSTPALIRLARREGWLDEPVESKYPHSPDGCPLPAAVLSYLRDAAAGMTYMQVAQRWGVSRQAVAQGMTRARQLLGVTTSLGAIERCARSGWLGTDVAEAFDARLTSAQMAYCQTVDRWLAQATVEMMLTGAMCQEGALAQERRSVGAVVQREADMEPWQGMRPRQPCLMDTLQRLGERVQDGTINDELLAEVQPEPDPGEAAWLAAYAQRGDRKARQGSGEIEQESSTQGVPA